MTGNGKHATYKHGDDRGMVRLWHCFSHITPVMGFLQSWGIPSGRFASPKSQFNHLDDDWGKSMSLDSSKLMVLRILTNVVSNSNRQSY